MTRMPTRYSSAHLMFLPHGPDRFLVRQGDHPTTIGNEPARLLMSCMPFRTLDEHAAAASSQVDRVRASGSVDRAAIEAGMRRQLTALVDNGSLLSEADALARHARAVPGATDVDPIESIGVVTRNRPDILRRCLASVGDMLARTDRRVRLVVGDDSSSEVVREENRAALDEAGQRLGLEVQYVGAHEKAQLADQLAARSGIARSLVELAITGTSGFGVTIGANRNALLLSTAGELTLQIDDDIHWRIAEAPGRLPGLRFAPANEDPTELRFHPDRAAALASAPAVEVDGLGAHEALLGRTLGSCVSRGLPGHVIDQPIFDGPLDSAFMRHLLEGSGRVVATSFGIVGDSGTWSPHQLLLLRGASRRDLMARFDDAVRTREVVRAAPQTSLVRGGFFMSGAVGLDNRVFLPPYFPVGRNEDGCFGLLVSMCSPSSYFAHLPWTIAHEPDQPRTFAPDAIWADAGATRLSDLIMHAMLTWSPLPRPSSSRERTVGLGAHLEQVGRLPLQDFFDLLTFGLLGRLDRYRRTLLDNLRSAGPLPPAMQRAATQQLATLEARATSAELASPRDLPGGGSVGEQLGRVQSLVAEFGRLLQVWPDLIDAAQDLRDG
jgi:hypothetical protein